MRDRFRRRKRFSRAFLSSGGRVRRSSPFSCSRSKAKNRHSRRRNNRSLKHRPGSVVQAGILTIENAILDCRFSPTHCGRSSRGLTDDSGHAEAAATAAKPVDYSSSGGPMRIIGVLNGSGTLCGRQRGLRWLRWSRTLARRSGRVLRGLTRAERGTAQVEECAGRPLPLHNEAASHAPTRAALCKLSLVVAKLGVQAHSASCPIKLYKAHIDLPESL